MKQEDKNNNPGADKAQIPVTQAQHSEDIINSATSSDYKYGFVSDIDSEIIPQGLNEEVVRLISAKKASLNGCWNSVLRHSATGRQ